MEMVGIKKNSFRFIFCRFDLANSFVRSRRSDHVLLLSISPCLDRVN